MGVTLKLGLCERKMAFANLNFPPATEFWKILLGHPVYSIFSDGVPIRAIGVRQSRTNISDISATGIDAVTAVLEATRKIGIVLVMPSVSV